MLAILASSFRIATRTDSIDDQPRPGAEPRRTRAERESLPSVPTPRDTRYWI